MAGRKSKKDAALFDADPLDPMITETAEAIEAAAAELDVDPLAEAVAPIAVETETPPARAPLPVGDWSDVEIVPKYLLAGYSTKAIVHADGVRGVMVIDGVLKVSDAAGRQVSRIPAAGYAFFARGQAYSIEAEKNVRAVFIQTPGYDETAQEYVAPVEVAAPAAPVASDAPSWGDASPSVRGAVLPPAAPEAINAVPIAHAVVSKASLQLAAMQAQRGRKGVRVSHPNDVLPVPSAVPVNPANGAPRPVQDSAGPSWTGERLVS
jgi:hypothetical protein